MSAIAGMIDWRGGPAGPAVKVALAALTLHGRDGEGMWDGGDVALGWRQTFLHAEDYAESQPVTGGAGRFKVVFDGHLDNREDLARNLSLAPDQARDWPDSRYVMAAFEKWGEDFPARLLGDFAIAIWDSEKRELLLARDHFGRRLLVYHAADGFFFFATMPSALFTHPQVPRAIDEESFVTDICLRSLPAGRTHFRGIARVPLAHSLRVSAGGQTVRRYWRLCDTPALHLPSDDAYLEAFRERLDAAVASRLRTIHPVGSHLSSGWDSSGVTATAARLLAQRGQRLTAFTHVPPQGWRPSIAVRGQIPDEGPLAAMVAARFSNIDHVLVPNTGSWDFEGSDYYAEQFERPLRQINNGVWWNALHRTARARGVRVILSGMEGNTTISYHGLDRLAGLLRAGRLATFFKETRGLEAAGYSPRFIAAFALAPFIPDGLWDRALHVLGKPRPKLQVFNFLNPALIAEYGLDWRMADGKSGASNVHRLGRAVMLHRAEVDHATFTGSALAAWDLEIRDPTGDKRVAEFCCAIPIDQFLRGGQTRWLMRRAMTGVLPGELLWERGRGRQAANWFETAAKAVSLILNEVEMQRRCPAAARLLDIARIRADLMVCRDRGTPLQPTMMNELMLRSVALGRFVRRFQGDKP